MNNKYVSLKKQEKTVCTFFWRFGSGLASTPGLCIAHKQIGFFSKSPKYTKKLFKEHFGKAFADLFHFDTAPGLT